MWIGKILECRAASPSHVWIRIMYLYWPHELPEHLQRSYYGQHELIASNHMEVVDAQCVEDLAAVVQISDTDGNTVPATSLYWRQYFDFLENKVSVSMAPLTPRTLTDLSSLPYAGIVNVINLPTLTTSSFTALTKLVASGFTRTVWPKKRAGSNGSA